MLPPAFWTYLKVVLLVALVPAIVGFVIVLAERRLMGFMQARLGPNRVGPEGTLQGLADLLKLVTKEDITPSQAEKAVHFLAPVLTVIPALTLASWRVRGVSRRAVWLRRVLMRPSSVALPVATTTPVAVPCTTRVPL